MLNIGSVFAQDNNWSTLSSLTVKPRKIHRTFACLVSRRSGTRVSFLCSHLPDILFRHLMSRLLGLSCCSTPLFNVHRYDSVGKFFQQEVTGGTFHGLLLLSENASSIKIYKKKHDLFFSRLSLKSPSRLNDEIWMTSLSLKSSSFDRCDQTKPGASHRVIKCVLAVGGTNVNAA